MSTIVDILSETYPTKVYKDSIMSTIVDGGICGGGIGGSIRTQ